MGTKQTFDDLRRKIISSFEALDICLKSTEKDSYRLNLLLNDLESYLNDSKTDFEVIITCCFQDYFTDLQYRRKKTLDIEINELDYDQMDFQKILEESMKVPKKKSCTELLNDFFDKQSGWQNMEWLWEWQGVFLNIIEINNFDSLNDLPKTETNKPDFETVFFPSEFTTLYQLQKALLKYCEPQQPEPHPEPKKKQATSSDSKYHVVNGQNWNTSDRYDLLNALGFVKQLEDSGLTKNEVLDILAIVLKTTFEYTRKTSYGGTGTQSNQIEQIEHYKSKFRSPKKT